MSESAHLTNEMILVLSVLFFTTFLFISNLIRGDIVAILVLVILGLTRLLPPEQLFSGFSSEAVIAIIAIMIISAGLENVGITLYVVRWVLKIGKEHPYRISIVMMSMVGLLASIMRSLGTVALFLPIATRVSSRTGISKKYLLMPIAFCSILGGTLTMVGSGSLILLNSLLENAYQYVHQQSYFMAEPTPFSLFEVMPIGFVLLLVGMIYLLFVVPKMIPPQQSSSFNNGTTRSYFRKTYGKGCDIFELRVGTESPLVNMNLRDLELKLDDASSILAVQQGKEFHFPPLRKIVIKANAALGIMGHQEQVAQFAKENGLKLLPKLNVFAEALHPVRAGLAEAVIPPSSQLIGQEVRELHMKRTHKLQVLALYRGNAVYKGDELSKLSLRSGDTLGLFAQWDLLDELKQHSDFVVITSTYPKEKIFPKKMPHALFFFITAIALVVIGKFPISVGLMFGAVGMIATGVISAEEAYRKVNWNTVFLIAGLIPLGLVMQTTGTTDWFTRYIIVHDISLPEWSVHTFLAIASTILSLVISNIGAAVLLIPLAMEVAINVGADPRMYALTAALAASNTFVFPSNQVNALIAGPGGYQRKHFLVIGGGLTVIYWIVMLTMVRLLFA